MLKHIQTAKIQKRFEVSTLWEVILCKLGIVEGVADETKK
jgi:hypothetical protein